MEAVYNNLIAQCFNLLLLALWAISVLVFLLYIIKHIVKPYCHNHLERKNKKLEFKHKKELETFSFSMNLIRSENSELEKLKKEVEDKNVKTQELEAELKSEPDALKRTALIYKLLQNKEVVTSEMIAKTQEEVNKAFEEIEKTINNK